MKIGVDARCLAQVKAGIGRNVSELCKELSKNHNQIYCYMPTSLHPTYDGLEALHLRAGNCNSYKASIYWWLRTMPRIIREDNLDVFWAPSHRLSSAVAQALPTVLTINDLVWQKVPRTMRLRGLLAETCFMKKSVRNADVVAAISQATADDLKAAYGTYVRNIHIIYPGISRFNGRLDGSAPTSPQTDLPENYFLMVSTIEPRKNHRKLLEAYSQLSADQKNKMHLVIVGQEGWGNVNVRAVIGDLGLKSHVHHLSGISDAELDRIYQNCAFLAMPSLYEGFGIPIVEAMSYGKPVLTSNISSMPEVAGEAGLLVDPHSVASIKNALAMLIDQPDLRSAKASHAKKLASRFTWEQAGQQLQTALHEAVEIRKNK